MEKLKYALAGVGFTCCIIAFVLLFIDRRQSPSTAESLPPSPSISATTAPSNASSERTSMEQDIKMALADYFDTADIDITVSGSTQTVSAFSADLTADISTALQSKTVPDEWADTVAALTSIEAEMPRLPGITRNVLYVKSERDGDIYLTISNGVVNYNVIEPPDDGHTFGPGYMTMDIFNQITTGMSYGDVVNLAGAPGTLDYESTLSNGDRYATYSWNGNGAFLSSVSITFIGEKVDSKHQFGLE